MDLVLILVLLLFMRSAAKKGFVTTIIRLFGWVLSAFISLLASNALSKFLFQSFMRPSLTEKIAARVEEMAGGADMASKLAAAFEEIPGFFLNALSLRKEEIISGLTDAVGSTSNQLAENIVDAVIAPTAILMMSALLFGLIFWLCCFIVKRVAMLFKSLQHVPLVGPVNTTLGAVAGLLQGILVVSVALIFINLITLVTGNQVPFFSTRNIESTWLLKWFYYYNPFLS